MSGASTAVRRFSLLDALRALAKSGATIEASVVTTFAFDAPFYEEVLLRAFERAGSRLNLVIVDARQFAASVNDPMRQPTRAGKDYLLAPVSLVGAFHPKIVAALSEKSSVLGVGSHNATTPGFGHNEEITTFWKGPPQAVLLDAIRYCLFWLGRSGAAQGSLFTDIEQFLLRLGGMAKEQGGSECRFMGAHPETESLWAQTVRHIGAPVRRVCLVGPYFDTELQFLNRISDELKPDEIIVGLQPDTAVLEVPAAAPTTTRFVDSKALGAFWQEKPGAGFAHGKTVLFETDAGPIVSLGSANPTWAAWLGGEHSNAEANVLLTGATAAKAVTDLGMDLLPAALPISADVLQEVANRNRAQRKREREQDETRKSTPVRVGIRDGDTIVVAGLDRDNCHSVFDLQGGSEFQSASFSGTEEGVVFTTEPLLIGGGLYRIDGENAPVAFVMVNDEATFRRQTRSRDSAAVLDHLGRLDSYDNFDEMLALIQRHVFDEVEPAGTGSTSTGKVSVDDEPDRKSEPGEAKPFGPRGVSIATLDKSDRKHLLAKGLISELIAALIRSMGPAFKTVLDGDGPNRDSDDTSPGELSDEEVAKGQEAEQPDVDWPRLVTACRKRIGVLIKRLKDELGKPIPEPERAAWLFSRILLVLCLLQRLRTLPPAPNVSLGGHKRPASLVGLSQMRDAFKVAMYGMYGAPGVASLLEKSPGHRASEDRVTLDGVLLWAAQEVGADYEAKAPFNELAADKERRLGDMADVVMVAMSAAAHPTDTMRLPGLGLWEDAPEIAPDWLERHRTLGVALQSGFAGSSLPTLKRRPKVAEFAFWKAEPGLPRLVRTLAGDKITLFEPGTDAVSPRKIVASFLDAVDLAAVVAMQRTEKPDSASP